MTLDEIRTVSDALTHYEEHADDYSDIVFVNDSTRQFIPEDQARSLTDRECYCNDMMTYLYVWVKM